jgi:hypothetical protein
LDNFISPIPGFNGDIPIPAIPVLTQPPGDESTSDPSARVGASALKTRAGKRKATTNLTPQKKARITMGRSASGIKINEYSPKTSASTPPLGPWRKILIQRLKRYACHEHISFMMISNL